MSSRFSHTSGLAKIVIIVEFVLVSYLLYSLTKNVYSSYQIDKYIATFEAENQAIADENYQKTEDYLYYTSPEYIDKIAKQNLGLVNPGEEVIILSPNVLEGEAGAEVDGDFAVDGGLSTAGEWWKFFFAN